MNKKLFVLLVVLMSLSLVGIIFVQGYWIRTSVQNNEEQFSNVVAEVLNNVVEKVEQRELQDYYSQVSELVDSVKRPKSSELQNFFFIDRDISSNEIMFYSHGILEEKYDVSSTLFENGNEIADGSANSSSDATVSNYTTKRTKAIYREEYGLDGKPSQLLPIQRWEKIGNLSQGEKLMMDDVFMQYAKRRPIHKRVETQELDLLIGNELQRLGLDLDYEYGIVSEGYPTRIRSKYFSYNEKSEYKAPIFRDMDSNTAFALMVNFPKKRGFLVNSILGMAMLSLAFTLIIVLAFVSAIYQLIRQKQISEIKSDFINNMTHEFKTPIATINLAVEAIRNPSSIGDQEKVLRYLGMIREENKRMHAQVENVLRISKLEKNQLDIKKERMMMHDLIQTAVDHIQLIVDDRQGKIEVHLESDRDEVLANETHMTNVLVNILDNAVKYSPESPKIEVKTELLKNQILISIKDEGAGMSKTVLKKVFEKFYREHTGNIHNVKGHGLGLAYVKKIVEDHQGEVYAESERGKGSTFYIKLPLI
ncbi:sensor histidine kinase [Aureicoccus marinus]|uniref:histidine kinase n=1 Tax=Aureicoccus marinus TaxID=754435 RepID=A0A2S7T4K5_9FLAO|nr:HAMP domain-containing sensor histidine kinase [Aureicoccus marinus]PQJ14872.1 two-component sensor histidine kinase [Aureicoccus marinus]